MNLLLMRARGGSPVPSISIAASSAALSLTQGGTTTTTVTLTRSNYTSTVTLGIGGTLPSGVTASWSNPTLSGGTLTSVLTFTATGGATVVGSSAFTITASGSGVSDATINAR